MVACKGQLTVGSSPSSPVLIHFPSDAMLSKTAQGPRHRRTQMARRTEDGWWILNIYGQPQIQTRAKKCRFSRVSYFVWPSAMDELHSVIEKQLWRRVWLNYCTRPIIQQVGRIHETHWNIPIWHRGWNLTYSSSPAWRDVSASTVPAPWGQLMT